MVIGELLRKWFGLEPIQCPACEILREQLTRSEHERRELLQRVLAPIEPTSAPITEEEPVAITPQFVPWRVRQQMLEQEDRKKFDLMRKHQANIAELEKELLTDTEKEKKDASQERGPISVHANDGS